ncbi:endonuclease domain-containing protein [Aeromonas encheleia]|uniref:Endonuclease domain-containing protein n=1 Tax=Aeromonas encheleia TaxID=73010 RepID=A0AAE9SDB9_9GAMM|nr:endonuclease domain-containing protein [Aeromonas encheleia]UNP87927.1 endonuclease domain-containing protein [Aeromonas encheleia]USV58296.1 endonuclease domain-containing protein [Aeromonas encheleia]
MKTHHFAKRLRAEATLAEQRLWFQLRNRRLMGLKFRRQLPIGPYIVDFVCVEQRLVIEVDGSQHHQPEGQRHDDTRTAYLNGEGFRVIRVWNNEVLGQMDAVLAFIRLSLQ